VNLRVVQQSGSNMTAMPLQTPIAPRSERDSDPLARIDERLANLEQSVARAERVFAQLPQLLAMVTDTLDQHILAAEDAGLDPGERIAALLKIAERLTTPAALGLAETLVTHLPNLHRLLDSELLSPGAVQTVSNAGTALAAAAESSPERAGLITALRALRDPAVQRALGFALKFAQLFGHMLEPAQHALPPRTTG
jgi:uncharacterized protein YjgD (DUF1641 family)